MRRWLHSAAWWLPAWILASQPVGYLRGYFVPSLGIGASILGSAAYCGIGFAAGYWIARTNAPDRPAIKAAGGVLGILAFFAFTAIGR